MNYDELNDLKKAKDLEILKWKTAIFNVGIELKENISRKLKTDGKKWNCLRSGFERDYVEAISLKKDENDEFKSLKFADTVDWTLIFGIQLCLNLGKVPPSSLY